MAARPKKVYLRLDDAIFSAALLIGVMRHEDT
jgi:hypothetical protein